MTRVLLVLALVSAALAVNSSVGSAPGVRSYAFLGAKWPDHAIPVPYCVNPAGIPLTSTNQQIMSPQAFVQAVRNAFDTWQRLPDSYIAFEFTGICNNDPRVGNDGVNTVGWGRLGGGAAGVAAIGATHTTPLRRSLAGHLLEVDITIDDRTHLGFDQQTYLNQIFPVIILHEVGHFLGLAHSERGCAVMAPSSLQLELCEDDIEGARILYPGPERATNMDVREVSCGPVGVDVLFTWSPSPEVDGYYFDLTLDPFWSAWFGIFAGARSTNALRLGGVLPGVPHYWRLWNFGGGLGGHGYGPTFVTPHCFSGLPVPGGPTDLNVSAACAGGAVTARFSWSRALAAEGYYVDLTLDPFFGGFINAWVPGERTTSLMWAGLLPNTLHYYRVFAYNTHGGFHSYVASFTTPRC